MRVSPWVSNVFHSQFSCGLSYPEAADQVVSGEQLVHQELQSVFAAGLLKREDVKWPFINILKEAMAYMNMLK